MAAVKRARRAVGEVAEVRYTSFDDAQMALECLDGSLLGDSTLSIRAYKADDGTKVVVYGIPRGISQMVLKDHFSQVGPIAAIDLGDDYVETIDPPAKRFAPAFVQPTGKGRESSKDSVQAKGKDRGKGKTKGKSENIARAPPKLEPVDFDEGVVGEIRFDYPADCAAALEALHGTELMGQPISLEPDACSKDGTKLIVRGLPLGIEWQELKDHFSVCGVVAFAGIRPPLSDMFGTADLPPPEPGTGVGELRYGSSAEAQTAIKTLNGSMLHGKQLTLHVDGSSKDGTKLVVCGISPSVEWQELKDHFSQCGVVAFANITSRGFAGGASGKGMGKKGGKKGGSMAAQAPPWLQRRGEVRFDELNFAQRAVEKLNGTILGGSPLQVQVDETSKDRTKVICYGLASNIEWQDLKDHFSQIGQVAFCEIFAPPPAVAATAAHAAQVWQGQAAGGASHGAFNRVGEVRFEYPGLVDTALEVLNGYEMDGCVLKVIKDLSHDSKIMVNGMPLSMGWQQLKDLCKELVGDVAFCAVH